MGLFNIIYFVVGLGFGYALFYLLEMKNKNLRLLVKCVKKKIPVAWLETDKAVYFKPLLKIYRGLGITKDKDIVIIPRSSAKPCINLGGMLVIHGDLYKSVGTVQEVRKFINDLLRDGWKDEEIARFLHEIESYPSEELKKHYLFFKQKKEKGEPVNEKEAKKYDIYVNLPSTVKDYIYTGLNRVSIHDMLRELVYQRELERLGKKNWLTIAIAFMIVVVAIAIGIKVILGTPAIQQMITGPAKIAPTP